MKSHRKNETQNNIQSAENFLSNIDTDWKRHVSMVGSYSHAPKPMREPYEALIRAIAYQQLHAKAGDAILTRFLSLYQNCTFPKPEQILETDFEVQKFSGFSAAKLSTIRAIAQATIEGVIPTRHLAMELSDDELISRFVTLHGVGRWTVEMFLIYTMERPDVLPVDDFGVREGYRRLKN